MAPKARPNIPRGGGARGLIGEVERLEGARAASARRASDMLRSQPTTQPRTPAFAPRQNAAPGVFVLEDEIKDILAKAERGEQLTAAETRLLNTPPENIISRSIESLDGNPVDGAAPRPFVEVDGRLYTLSTEGQPIVDANFELMRIGDDGNFFMYPDGDIVDVEGNVVAKAQMDGAADAVRQAELRRLDREGMTGATRTPPVKRPLSDEELDTLASQITQATNQSAAAGSEPLQGLPRLQQRVAGLSPDQRQDLLSRFRWVPQNASDAVRAAALADAEQMLSRLDQMAERARRSPSEAYVEQLEQQRAQATPAPARRASTDIDARPADIDPEADRAAFMERAARMGRTPEEAEEAYRRYAGRMRVSEGMLPPEVSRQAYRAVFADGDWNGITADLNSLPDDQRAAIIQSLPEDSRAFVAQMLVDGSFQPNAVGRMVSPANEVDDLFMQLQSARAAGRVEDAAAIEQLLREAQQATDGSDPRIMFQDAVSAYQTRNQAFDNLRQAMMNADETYTRARDRANRLETTRQQPTVAASGSRAIDATPERGLQPRPIEELKAIQREQAAAAETGSPALPKPIRSTESRLAMVNEGRPAGTELTQPQQLPIALKDLYTKSQNERFPQARDMERLAAASALQARVDAATALLDDARAELVAQARQNGATFADNADTDAVLAAAAPEAYARFREAEQQVAEAYSAIDKAYGSKVDEMTPSQERARETRYRNRQAELTRRLSRLQDEYANQTRPAGGADTITRGDGSDAPPAGSADTDLVKEIEKTQAALDRLTMPQNRRRRGAPAAGVPSDSRLQRRNQSQQETFEQMVNNAEGRGEPNTGLSLSRSSVATAADNMVDWSPDEGAIEAIYGPRPTRLGRLGGNVQRSRQQRAIEALFRNRRGEMFDPIALFGSPEAAADFLMSRRRQWVGRESTPGYQLARDDIARSIDEAFGARAGSQVNVESITPEGALRSFWEDQNGSLTVGNPARRAEQKQKFDEWLEGVTEEQVDEAMQWARDNSVTEPQTSRTEFVPTEKESVYPESGPYNDPENVPAFTPEQRALRNEVFERQKGGGEPQRQSDVSDADEARAQEMANTALDEARAQEMADSALAEARAEVAANEARAELDAENANLESSAMELDPDQRAADEAALAAQADALRALDEQEAAQAAAAAPTPQADDAATPARGKGGKGGKGRGGKGNKDAPEKEAAAGGGDGGSPPKDKDGSKPKDGDGGEPPKDGDASPPKDGDKTPAGKDGKKRWWQPTWRKGALLGGAAALGTANYLRSSGASRREAGGAGEGGNGEPVNPEKAWHEAVARGAAGAGGGGDRANPDMSEQQILDMLDRVGAGRRRRVYQIPGSYNVYSR